MSTLREQAKVYVNTMSGDELESMIVRSHKTNSHKWVECMPDGTVHETEEADNNTTHWIDYPNKAVATIYNIADECAEACNCDICCMYRRFRDDDKEDFIADYSEEDWDSCNEHTQEEAILYYEYDNGTDCEAIREQMLDGIDEIEYGYFNDEDA